MGNAIELWIESSMLTSPSAAHEDQPPTDAETMSLHEDQGDYLRALVYARKVVARDPTRHDDVQRLTRLHVLHGSRAPHLTTLQRRFHAARQGYGSLTLVHGVAGIGKSSFARAVTDWARRQGALSAVGRCFEHGVALTMAPWLEALRSLATATARSADHLPAPFGPQPHAASSDALITQVGNYLEELIAANPAVVVLDDLQWADHESLDLLEYITRRIERLPLLLMATYRSDEVGDAHQLYPYLTTLQRDRPTHVIQLREFSRDDVSRYTDAHLGACTPDLVRYLHQRTDGHPLFLAELLDDLTEQKLITRNDDGQWTAPSRDVPMPTLLHQIITQRVSRLGPRCESMLDVAAVIGDVWTLATVETLLGAPEDQLLDDLEELLASRMIEVDDMRGERYRFSHGLIREALYRRQLPRRRRSMHGRIADLLEATLAANAVPDGAADDEIVGEIAYHAFCAEQWPRAYRFGCEAVNQAAQRHALHAVLRYGRQTCEAAALHQDAVTPESLLALHEQLGYAALRLGRKDDALESFRQMLSVAADTDDRQRVASAMFRLAEAQERTYDHARSAETRQMALGLVEEETAPMLLARYHFSMVHHGLAVGELDLARKHLPEAEDHARAVGDEQLLLDCGRYRGYLTIFDGEYEQGERLTAASLVRARGVGDAPRLSVACWQLGFVLIERGEYERARQFLLEGLEQADMIGEHHYYVVRTRNLLGYLYREIGDVAAAIRWNQAALDTNPLDGSQRLSECACYSLIDMAANHLAAGRLNAVDGYLREFASHAAGASYGQYRYGNRAQLLRTELALVREEYDLALARAVEATEVAERVSMRKNVARGLLLQGRVLRVLGRGHEAAVILQRAMEVADAIDHAALRWQTRLALAEVYEQLGRNADGPRLEAATIVQTIVGKLQDPAMRTAFLSLPPVMFLAGKEEPSSPVATEQGSRRDSLPAGLTPREVEVLQLVAAGLTDRQIGEQLHIALRTVNSHVTNILNKTGCDNRTAAAAFAVRHKLTGADN